MQRPSAPLISVVMPVRDGVPYVGAAIESILAQTLGDFEFIVVDDGSTDNTAALVGEAAARDGRVCLYRRSRSAGVALAMNAACRMARGRYIARMDADDIALPERFERQVDFLERHPDIGILGTDIVLVDAQGQPLGVKRYPASPAQVAWWLCFSSALAHPSVMMRRDLLRPLGYYHRLVVASDYDLWVRALAHTRLANLPEPLLQYRIWPHSLSSRQTGVREAICVPIAQRAIGAALGRPVSLQAAAALRHSGRPDYGVWPSEPAGMRDAIATLRALYAAFTRTHDLSTADARLIREDYARRLLRMATLAARAAPPAAGAALLEVGRARPLTLADGVGRAIRKRLRPRGTAFDPRAQDEPD